MSKNVGDEVESMVLLCSISWVYTGKAFLKYQLLEALSQLLGRLCIFSLDINQYKGDSFSLFELLEGDS